MLDIDAPSGSSLSIFCAADDMVSGPTVWMMYINGESEPADSLKQSWDDFAFVKLSTTYVIGCFATNRDAFSSNGFLNASSAKNI